MEEKNWTQKLKALFKLVGFHPTKTFKGPTFGEPPPGEYKKNQTYETAVYEGVYKNNTAVLKAYFPTPKNKLNFTRNLYLLTIGRNQNKILKELLPRFYTAGNYPLDYLITEKLKGKPLGNWFNLKAEPKVVRKIIKKLFELNRTFSMPKKLYKNFVLSAKGFFEDQRVKENFEKFNLPKIGKTYYKLEEEIIKLWRLEEKGFLFHDVNGSNFLCKKDGKGEVIIKRVDFDDVSFGAAQLDIGTLYFAALGNPGEKVARIEAERLFRKAGRIRLFYFICAYRIIKHIHKIKELKDKKKIKSLLSALPEIIAKLN